MRQQHNIAAITIYPTTIYQYSPNLNQKYHARTQHCQKKPQKYIHCVYIQKISSTTIAITKIPLPEHNIATTTIYHGVVIVLPHLPRSHIALSFTLRRPFSSSSCWTSSKFVCSYRTSFQRQVAQRGRRVCLAANQTHDLC